jgi:hypothetical protein
MDPTNADLLQQCSRYFPGLAWGFDHDGDCNADFYGIDFYLSPEIDGSFSASILFNDNPLRWDWEVKGLPSAASALAAASARWKEFAALAMTIVEQGPGWMAEPVLVDTKEFRYDAEAQAVVELPPQPKPAYKPSPEIQRQSDMGIVAHMLAGQRRKDLGLPPDPQAQARAGADAMAWAEDNPPDPKPIAKAFAEPREKVGDCFAGQHFDSETREWVEDDPE